LQQQQRWLQFQRLRLIYFILFSHLPPRSFLHGGIFLPSEIKFPYIKAISRSRAAEILNS
jgi:hypothetical protein